MAVRKDTMEETRVSNRVGVANCGDKGCVIWPLHLAFWDGLREFGRGSNVLKFIRFSAGFLYELF